MMMMMMMNDDDADDDDNDAEGRNCIVFQIPGPGT